MRKKKADRRKGNKISIIEEAIKQIHVQINETIGAVHALKAKLALFQRPDDHDQGSCESDRMSEVTNANHQMLVSVRCYACGHLGNMRCECQSCNMQNTRQQTSQSYARKLAGSVKKLEIAATLNGGRCALF